MCAVFSNPVLGMEEEGVEPISPRTKERLEEQLIALEDMDRTLRENGNGTLYELKENKLAKKKLLIQLLDYEEGYEEKSKEMIRLTLEYEIQTLDKQLKILELRPGYERDIHKPQLERGIKLLEKNYQTKLQKLIPLQMYALPERTMSKTPQPKSSKSYKISDLKRKGKDTTLTEEDIRERVKKTKSEVERERIALIIEKAESEAIRRMEERRLTSETTIEETETISTTAAPTLKEITDEGIHSLAMSLINACEALKNNNFEEAELVFVEANLLPLQSDNYEKLMLYWLSQTITILNKYAKQMNYEGNKDTASSASYQAQRAEELKEDIERILSSKFSGFHDFEFVQEFRRRAEIVNNMNKGTKS